MEGAFVSLVRGGKGRGCDFVRPLKSVLKLFLGRGEGGSCEEKQRRCGRGGEVKGEAADLQPTVKTTSMES